MQGVHDGRRAQDGASRPAPGRGARIRVQTVLRSRDFRRLLGARLTSQIAEGAFLAAVLDTVVFLPQRQSTLLGFALASAFTLLPFSLVEPFAGVFMDRWPRRRIIVSVPLIRIAVSLLILPGLTTAALYAGTLVVFSLNRFYGTTAGAVIPRVLPGDGLATPARPSAPDTPADRLLFDANMITAVACSLAVFGGLFMGGRLAAAVGVPWVLALTAAAWVCASLLGGRLSTPLPPERPPVSPVRGQLGGTMADLADGFRRIARTPSALLPTLTVAAGQFLQVVVISATLLVITQDLGGGIELFSALVAAGGVGVFAGFLTAGAMRSRLSNPLLIGVAFALAALAVVPASLVTIDTATLAIGAVLLGASYGWTRVPVDTLAQRAVPDEYRGRVFAAIDLGFNTARVLGALAAVVVVPVLGPRTTFIAVAVLFLIWAPVTPLWLGAGRERRQTQRT